jgi:riboflavin kinase, archaea type
MKDPLLELALINAAQKPIQVSAVEFAKRLRTSPMTASRRLKELEDGGLIARMLSGRSQAVIITEKGSNALKEQYLAYKSIFESIQAIELSGTIVSGLGEGRYYLSIRGYTKQFEERLGFTPYPGTLNVKLDDESAAARVRLDNLTPIYISSFKTSNRTYGGIRCYMASIGGIDGAVIVPDRSHYHNDVIETVAPVSIKRTLNIDNGDLIKVVII